MRRILTCACALLVGVVPLAEARVQDAQLASIQRALDEGRYADALVSAREYARAAEGGIPQPSSSQLDGLDFLVEASCRDGQGTASTESLAERALALRRRAAAGAPTVRPLQNLGCVQLLRGHVARAVETYARAWREASATPGAATRARAALAADSAQALIDAGRYEDALTRLGAVPEFDRDVRVLALQGTALQRLGRYDAARAAITRVLDLSRESQNPLDRVDALTVTGDQAWFDGDMVLARTRYSEALTLAERLLRPGHPGLRAPLLNLAAAHESLGDTSRARVLRVRAVALVEAALGPAHPLMAIALNDLANSDLREADYPSALSRFTRARRVRQAALGPMDIEVATAWHNISYVHAELGDWREARRAHDMAAAIWRRRLGPAHPYIARAHFTLAQALENAGRLASARVWFERALAIQERLPGATQPDVAETLTRLANVAIKRGADTEADRLADRAVRVARDAGVLGSGIGAAALEVQGDALLAQSDVQSAERAYGEALAAAERAFGPSHTRVSGVRFKLARTLLAQGQTEPAIDLALESAALDRALRLETIRFLPERQALSYLARQPASLDLAIQASLSAGATRIRDLLQALIDSRGAVLDEVASRRAAAGRATSTEVASALADVRAARERLAQLVVAGPGAMARFESVVDEARRARDEAERRLAASATRGDPAVPRIEAGAVLTHLPERSALVSFYRYRHGTELRYVVFVTLRGTEPRIVPLGPASRIERAVAAWRTAMTPPLAGGSSLARTGRALADLVWEPVARSLADVDRVFVVPDGELHKVNVAALPRPDGRYVVEAGPVTHVLSTERDLLTGPGEIATAGLLAVGAPAFGAGSAASADGACQAATFSALPGTMREVADIAALWKQSDTAVTAAIPEVLTGVAATEARFKALAPGRRVLHLATHGFVATPACGSSGSGARAVGGVTASAPAPVVSRVLDDAPLAGPGLALAGANRARRGRSANDGILTAEEVAGLNLDGTEWAVLSACDTGLGQIRAGEGVFGLRRAFQLAGVRTVIMSLWPVDDGAARQWMAALYAARLRDRLSTVDAVRHASLAVLRARRAGGFSTNPFYWAAFVAAGDWR
ncbi:MAG: CHAT domain-containing protein [Vicinamibacterales bacterium]